MIEKKSKHSIYVDVCMPVYNGEAYIYETLKAYSEQSYPYFRLLVSNDASSDNTSNEVQRFIEDFPDINLVYFEQPHNLGVIGNCNFLINQIELDFVIFTAGDDRPTPHRLELQVDKLNEGYDVCFGNYQEFLLSGDSGYCPKTTNPEREFDWTSYHKLKLNTVTVMMKSILAKGRFHTNQYNDMLFYFRIFEEERIRGYFLKDIIVFYGRDGNGLNAFALDKQYYKKKLLISYEVCKSTIYYMFQEKQISFPLLTYVTKNLFSLFKSIFLYGINTIST